MDPQEAANIVRLGPRVPRAAAMGAINNVMEIAVPSQLVERTPPTSTGSSTDTTSDSTASTTSSASTSTGSCGSSACEKPVSNSTLTMPIILGVA